ncbi:MAG: Bax inhibitor-1/YccA family protein, partial [Desulfovibrionales bacterium]
MADFRTASTTQAKSVTNVFMRGVYNWMAMGLGLTALTAYGVANTPAVREAIFGNSMVLILMVVGLFGMVIALSAAIHKMSATTATAVFTAYAALNGAVLSSIFVVYTSASIASTFVICAGMFGAMSLYGLTTKKDLTSWGSFLFMGLIGIVIAMVVNIFLQSSMLQFVISGVGVLVFTGLTAYDTQKIKEMGETAPMDDSTAIRRGTIMGALRLYLDFLNLFLMLLHFFGQTRD